MAEASPAPAPLEVEVKLRLAPETAAKIARHPAIVACKRGRARTTRMLAVYFDTTDARLARAGLALRVRHEGARWVQTIKGPASPSAAPGLPARVEINWPLPSGSVRPSLDLAALSDSPWKNLIGKASRKGSLGPVFTTAYERTTIPVAFDEGTTALVCIDRGEIFAGAGRPRGRRLPICEAEIELEAGSPTRLFDLALLLAADTPVEMDSRSKAERGFSLVHPAQARAARAEPVDIPASLSAAEALCLITANCVRQIEANAHGVAKSSDPEYVHQMRVGTRRLRSCLQLVGRHLPEGALDPLVTEVRWLADSLGPLRDIDVMLEETLPPLAAAARSDGTSGLAGWMAPLRQHSLSRRRRARTGARAAVGSPRFACLLLGASRACATPLFGADPASPAADVLRGPVADFASDVLARRHRKLLRVGSDLATASADERHQARIAAKRLRYAIDFFASLYSRKRVRAMTRAVARVQDALGRGNDAQVALTIATELVGEGSPATAALAGWAAARREDGEHEIGTAWAAFLASRPFWRRKVSN